MSNKASDNVLPKIPLTPKKKKHIKEQSNKSNNIQNEQTSSNTTQKTDDIITPKPIIKKEVKIIDEVTKNSKRIQVIKKKVYKIIFVYNNEDFYITVKLNTLIKNVRNSICQLIGLNINKISLVYNDVVIDESHDNKTVDEFFNLKNIKFRPIVYIIKKRSIEMESSHFNIIPKNYNYKIRIQNYPINQENNFQSKDNLDNIINNFFKNYYSVNNNNNNLENIYHYKIEEESLNEEEEEKEEEEKEEKEEEKDEKEEKKEKEEEKEENKKPIEEVIPTYIVCFSSQDIAFDFNRYINILKIVNPIFKEVKSNIIIPRKVIKTRNKPNTIKGFIKYGVDYGLEEGMDLRKRNSKILKLVRQKYLKKEELRKLQKSSSQESITGIGPYLSILDKERLQRKEDKKKWINPDGFISCVGKYSGIKL